MCQANVNPKAMFGAADNSFQLVKGNYQSKKKQNLQFFK